jgi:homoserine kinase type II
VLRGGFFSFNLTKGQALLNGYESVRPLSQAEVAALPQLWRAARRCASC